MKNLGHYRKIKSIDRCPDVSGLMSGCLRICCPDKPVYPIAGVQNSLFTEDAIEVIHEFCGGIARKVNNVCTACLLDAFAVRKTLIDDRMVKVVLENEFAA